MLKLPKGLKKKKKGKKSKKDQELFTEEELEQYRREHQKQTDDVSETNQPTADEREDVVAGPSGGHSHVPENPAPAEDADEWRRFNALATGVDSILKKTQGDLDRIKSTSFFKRVATPSEVQQKEDAIRAKQEEEQRLKEEEQRKLEEEKKADKLANAVIELSESEEEESANENDDIFDTTYIDVVKELPLAYVPESPEKSEDEGPDPFDTSYADTVITKVSRRGKALVNIGSAVEVLTGRVEQQVGKKTARRPRRGVQDLFLVQSFDDENADELLEKFPDEVLAPTKTLLDSPADLPDEPIDLTKSLHLSLAPVKAHEEGAEGTEGEQENKKSPKSSEDGDEQALLAFFGVQASAPKREATTAPAPPKRSGLDEIIGEGDFDIQEDDGIDPFDTQFVAKLLPASLNEDQDFDPRAENPDLTPPAKELFSPEFPRDFVVTRTDLLEDGAEAESDCPVSLVPSAQKEQVLEDIDPFDTSAVNAIVAPGKTELKFLEKELAKSGPPPRPPALPKEIANRLKPSLSDDDFDPRAEEETPPILTKEERKASLSLQITSHKVTFAVPSPDLLAIDHDGKIQKPLTPYYENPSQGKADSPEDPFDTSFVGSTAPSQVELSNLAKDLLQADNAAKLSDDDDFDPRAVTPQPKAERADWLAPEAHNIKVLTPAVESKAAAGQEAEESSYLRDPFDTSSIDESLKPGQAELKLIESELLPQKKSAPVVDFLSDPSQDDSLPVKALTPVVPFAAQEDNADSADLDPFDTSFACNIAPGRAEIKLLESELIEQ